MSNSKQIIWKVAFDSLETAFNSLEEGRIGKYRINNQWICMSYLGNQFFAFDDRCPHQGYSLIQGECFEGLVECPLHKYKFNLITGNGHGLKLTTYPVKVEDRTVYVGFRKSFWS